jgi:hypothetical protein
LAQGRGLSNLGGIGYYCSMFKNFLLKKMLRSQGVPEAQVDMFIGMMEKNPELFKTIALEIQAKTKEGKDQQTASMEVMQKYEAELRKLI